MSAHCSNASCFHSCRSCADYHNAFRCFCGRQGISFGHSLGVGVLRDGIHAAEFFSVARVALRTAFGVAVHAATAWSYFVTFACLELVREIGVDGQGTRNHKVVDFPICDGVIHQVGSGAGVHIACARYACLEVFLEFGACFQEQTAA